MMESLANNNCKYLLLFLVYQRHYHQQVTPENRNSLPKFVQKSAAKKTRIQFDLNDKFAKNFFVCVLYLCLRNSREKARLVQG